MLQAGFIQPKDSRDEIKRVLGANEGPGKIFVRQPSRDPRTGESWFFNNPADHISYPDRPLEDRVRDSVLAYLRQRISTKLDDVIAQLFKEYPNGLTPDPRTIKSYLSQFAFRSEGKWKISPEVMISATLHSETIVSILMVGKKLGAKRFVGRREQPERTGSGAILRDLSDLTSLTTVRGSLPGGANAIERLEMVDVVFLSDGRPELLCLWEVENSTKFTSAIQRGSNASKDVPKFMVIPEDREKELLAIVDPLFREQFTLNGWRYLTYPEVRRLASYASVSLGVIIDTAKGLSYGS